MHESNTTENWTDFMKFEIPFGSKVILIRNPYSSFKPDSGEIPDPDYLYPVAGGDEFSFDCEPIAQGFTAYVGYDAVCRGIPSLKTKIERK